MALRRAGSGYVLGVAASAQFASWSAELDVSGRAAEIAGDLPFDAWRRLSAGAGTRGPRLSD